MLRDTPISDQDPAVASDSRALVPPLLTALILAAVSCAAHALLSPELGKTFAAVLVGALGGVYLGGALRSGNNSEIAVNAVAAPICIILAIAGLHGPAWIIPAAYILHGIWDWIHHAIERRTVGAWWPPFCALFDFLFGAYLFIQLARGH